MPKYKVAKLATLYFWEKTVIINIQRKSHAQYAASGMDKALILTSDKGDCRLEIALGI